MRSKTLRSVKTDFKKQICFANTQGTKTEKGSHHQILLNMQQQLLVAFQMVGENQRKMSFSYRDSRTFHNEAHQNCNRVTRDNVETILSINLKITF